MNHVHRNELPLRTLVIGAAGRDFHFFNTRCRDNPDVDVVAFTAAQIPDIDGRAYPSQLAGSLYPNGIPIIDESELENIISEQNIDQVVFAYSDVSHADVMHLASRAGGAGADFIIPSTPHSMIPSKLPVVAITATRTGCGKSQTSRAVATVLRDSGLKVGVIRHPMPYGDLVKQRVQRFADYEDLAHHECTIEEREEYEPHIDAGHVVYAGVDYGAILEQVEQEADVVLWDGGNNDTPFYKPDLWICVTDPHRAGHGSSYHPGETNLRMADVIVINKTDSADAETIGRAEATIAAHNSTATVLKATSPFRIEGDIDVAGKRVLVVEDGPTVTHGGMAFGAGLLAAEQAGAGEIIDPRPHAVGSLVSTFEKYTHLDKVLPAMGYGDEQVADLAASIDAADCDMVVSGTPIDIARLLDVETPLLRVRYNLDAGTASALADLIRSKLSS